MSMRLHLVRHCAHGDVGRTLSGRAGGRSLTAAGRDHARRLGEGLAAERLAVIHSSPRERALETANAIAAPLGLEVEGANALDEIDFGEWQGRSFAELASDPRWHEWNAR